MTAKTSHLRVNTEPIKVVEHRGWPDPSDATGPGGEGWWVVRGGRKVHHWSTAGWSSDCRGWGPSTRLVRAINLQTDERCRACERKAPSHPA